MAANSSDRTEKLREEIKDFLTNKGVSSYFFTFADPDTTNWTWASGTDDPFAVGATRLAMAEFEERWRQGAHEDEE